MSGIPYTGAQALARIAARTTVARVVLGVALVALVLAAAAAARHPQLDKQPFVSPKAAGWSCSTCRRASPPTRTRASAQSLRRSSSREAAATGSSSSRTSPTRRCRRARRPRRSSRSSATSRCRRRSCPASSRRSRSTRGRARSRAGRRSRAGLDLARQIELANDARHPAVVLISDLADDPNDLQRLTGVIQAYHRDGIELRVVALNAAPNDAAYFKRLIGTATSIIPASLPASTRRAPRRRTRASRPCSSSSRSSSPRCSRRTSFAPRACAGAARGGGAGVSAQRAIALGASSRSSRRCSPRCSPPTCAAGRTASQRRRAVRPEPGLGDLERADAPPVRPRARDSSASPTSSPSVARRRPSSPVHALGNGYDNGYSESRARADLEVGADAISPAAATRPRRRRRQPARDPRVRRLAARTGRARPPRSTGPSPTSSRRSSSTRRTRTRSSTSSGCSASSSRTALRAGGSTQSERGQRRDTRAPAAACPGRATERASPRSSSSPRRRRSRCSRS